MRIATIVAAAGLAVAGLTASVSADAQSRRDRYDDRYEQRRDRYDDRYEQRRDRYHHWDRGRHYGWDRGRHYGWNRYNRHHRDCRSYWRHHRRVTVCYS